MSAADTRAPERRRLAASLFTRLRSLLGTRAFTSASRVSAATRPFVSQSFTSVNNYFDLFQELFVDTLVLLCHNVAQMTKSRLEYVVKARADYAMKTSVEQLTTALGFHDEADIVRAAISALIQRHRDLLPSHLVQNHEIRRS